MESGHATQTGTLLVQPEVARLYEPNPLDFLKTALRVPSCAVIASQD